MFRMYKYISYTGLLIILFSNFLSLSAQNKRKLNRQGVKHYNQENFSEAELSFIRALEKDSLFMASGYNIANTLYKQGKYEEAQGMYSEMLPKGAENPGQAELYHNLGNSFLKKQQYQESIEAYKQALRIRPDADDTRYNLAYAQAKLQEQQEQQQNQENNQNQDQENKDDKNNSNDNQEEQQAEDEEQQQNQQQQNQPQDNQDQQEGNSESRPQQALSKEDMERMLQAIQQQEKNVQEKLEKQKAKAAKVKTEKDW